MIASTFIYALVLVLLGVIGYTQGEAQSVTALIPAFFGAAVAVCGLLATRPSLRMHAMHGAALLCVLALVMHLAVFILRITGKMGEAASPTALGPQMMLLTAVASSVFLAITVRSFVQARRSRS